MAIFDTFRKQDSKEQKPVKKEAPKEKKSQKKPNFQFPRGGVLLRAPHITEKGAYLAEHGAYAFRVAKRANKKEIKKIVESMYGVNVEDVRVINVPSKTRRRGRIVGEKKGYKKAVVRVKEGQKIDVTA